MSKLSYHTTHCMALMQWVHLHEHQIPDLGRLVYIPNDGRRSRAEGGIAKAMGLKRGVWDYFLACPRVFEGSMRGGLWIEMKSPDDKLSEDQKFWGEKMLEEGYATSVVRTWMGATEVILAYLGKSVYSTARHPQWPN